MSKQIIYDNYFEIGLFKTKVIITFYSREKLFTAHSSSNLDSSVVSLPLRLKSRQTAITPTNGY